MMPAKVELECKAMKIINQGNPKPSAGFTLIELMIVIAIVAILVAIAVPAYRDYTIRAKVAECINNAAVAKVQISEFRQTLGSWPPTALSAGIDISIGVSSSQFCNGFINYDPGTGSFEIDVNETAVDVLLSTIAPVMTPLVESGNGNINWDCTVGSTVPSDIHFLPSTCRDT
ncbi:MAG: type IV pilus assembly protein PilA [Rhodothermales bacterium]|jgi:type IV pilus assembly protein PilA